MPSRTHPPSYTHPSRPTYSAPALDKGLDIIECLAAQRVPQTSAQIARALDRGQSELFRMLNALERRGYVHRDSVSGAYSLTLRLWELAHIHDPHEALVRAAREPMRVLTETVRESCHLGILYRGQLVILAQELSPEPVRLSVEVGFATSVVRTVSGRLLVAVLPEAERTALLAADAEYAALSTKEQVAFLKRLRAIAKRGYEAADSESVRGVFDAAVLAGSPRAGLKVALAVSSLARPHANRLLEDLLEPLRGCAGAIVASAGFLDKSIEGKS